MPKVKPTDFEERRRAVLACVASKKILSGWNDEQLAARGRVSMTTLRRRMLRPEDFTLGELWDMGITVYVYDGQSRLPTGDGLVALRG